MRKIFTCILLCALMMGLVACGGGEAEPVSGDHAGYTLTFTTEDLDGNKVSMEDYKEAKVILVNLFESWCGPCVEEIPDLEKLYEKYKGDGFLILGVFGDLQYQEDVRTLVLKEGISYPVLKSNQDFDAFRTQYVPTSFFVDGSGKVLSGELVMGARSYEEWEEMIREYLGG